MFQNSDPLQDIKTVCTSIHRQFVSPVMAVPSVSSSTALKKLEEQLTCGICLDLIPTLRPTMSLFCLSSMSRGSTTGF